MPRTIISVYQIDQRAIVVKLSDGTVMQFDLEELAMMSNYQISNRDEKIERLQIRRIQ